MRCKLVGALDRTLDDRGLADPIGGPMFEIESRFLIRITVPTTAVPTAIPTDLQGPATDARPRVHEPGLLDENARSDDLIS